MNFAGTFETLQANCSTFKTFPNNCWWLLGNAMSAKPAHTNRESPTKAPAALVSLFLAARTWTRCGHLLFLVSHCVLNGDMRRNHRVERSKTFPKVYYRAQKNIGDILGIACQPNQPTQNMKAPQSRSWLSSW